MRKLTQAQIKKLRKHWKALKQLEDAFYCNIEILESAMQHELDIPDLEFINIDGYCGIGNITRTIKLIQQEELEKNYG